MDIGPQRRVIQVAVEPAPHRVELDVEFEDVDEDIDEH